MWILFEDAPGTAVSELISLVYRSTSVNVGFSGGAGAFLKFIKDHKLEDERVIIYHDVVPDNPDTGSVYRKLRTKLRHYKGLEVVPVICTEYYILRSLLLNIPNLDDVVLNTKYPAGVTSAEKYYKYFLDFNTKECQALGRYSEVTEATGTYYTRDCNMACNAVCLQRTKLQKSRDINRRFPVVPAIEALGPFSATSVSDYISSFAEVHNSLVMKLSKQEEWPVSLVKKALI